jgi:putative DNA primase/helicase
VTPASPLAEAIEEVPRQLWRPSQGESAKRPRPVGVLLSEVEPEPITWLSPKRIAQGKVTLLDGDPGLGKTTLAIDFAARVSQGQPWPDGVPCPEGGVVILTAEDGLSDTVRPRLDAAGGNPGKVVALEVAGDDNHAVSIPSDLHELKRAIERVSASLVIVDPLMAFLDGATNSRLDHDVRRASDLSPARQRAPASRWW